MEIGFKMNEQQIRNLMKRIGVELIRIGYMGDRTHILLTTKTKRKFKSILCFKNDETLKQQIIKRLGD